MGVSWGLLKISTFSKKVLKKLQEPTIAEMLSKLESKSEVMADTVTNVCSMDKSKKGKVNPTKPSLALKK